MFSRSLFQKELTTVAGSIFRPLSQTSNFRSEFRIEILRSALLDTQVTLLCVCGEDSFLPELEHLMENLFHSLFSKKKLLKSDSWIQIPELKLRSSSSAEKNFADEITWITWKTEQNIRLCSQKFATRKSLRLRSSWCRIEKWHCLRTHRFKTPTCFFWHPRRIFYRTSTVTAESAGALRDGANVVRT